MEFSSGGYKRIPYVGRSAQNSVISTAIAAFGIDVEPVLRTVAATEPGFPIKMPVRDLELHSEL